MVPKSRDDFGGTPTMTNPRPMINDIERALRAAGGDAALHKTIEERAKSRDYLTRNYAELLEQYPEHWIAVHDSEVIAAELTLSDLARALTEKVLPISEILIRHMTTRPEVNFF